MRLERRGQFSISVSFVTQRSVCVRHFTTKGLLGSNAYASLSCIAREDRTSRALFPARTHSCVRRPLRPCFSSEGFLTIGDVSRKSDTDIVTRCLTGDQGAWSELIDRYQRLIYSVARTLSQSSEDAADVFQQVCLELYQRLPELRDAESLPAWLITVTRRQAAAVWKSHKTLLPLRDEYPALADQIRSIENEHLVETAMLDLPERCRQLINLLYLHPFSLSYSAVAERLGVPVSSIGPTRARCLAKLRKLMS